MMTHTIRLRSPWQLRELGRDGEAQSAGLRADNRAAVPGDWEELLGRDYVGRAQYRRVFHRPGGLDDGESVVLVIEHVRPRGEVSLNGQLLGHVAASGEEFHITELLAEPNELLIVIEHRGEEEATSDGLAAGGIPGDVRLEIRSLD